MEMLCNGEIRWVPIEDGGHKLQQAWFPMYGGHVIWKDVPIHNPSNKSVGSDPTDPAGDFKA